MATKEHFLTALEIFARIRRQLFQEKCTISDRHFIVQRVQLILASASVTKVHKSSVDCSAFDGGKGCSRPQEIVTMPRDKTSVRVAHQSTGAIAIAGDKPTLVPEYPLTSGLAIRSST